MGTRSGGMSKRLACMVLSLRLACANFGACAHEASQLSSDELAGNLSQRLITAGVKGRHLTLKIKRKKAGAPEPIKFLVSHTLIEQCEGCRAFIVTDGSFHKLDCFSGTCLVLRIHDSSLRAFLQTGIHHRPKLRHLALNAAV